MKKLLSITLGLCVLGLINSQAADEPKKEGKEVRGRKVPEAMLKKYDKNNDGKLDDSEREAMREDRKKEMKKYDTNSDGKLDDTERAAMREDLKKQAHEKGAAHGKKAEDKKTEEKPADK